MTCADRVRWWRERAGLSKAEAARRIGLSDVALGYWESDDTEPTQQNLSKFCDVVGITMAQFWGPLPAPGRVTA